jgi:iron complex outermembrane receptor protein
VIGGLRYWHDHKRGDYHAYETISGLTLNWGPGGISFYDPTGVANSADITVSPSAATPKFQRRDRARGNRLQARPRYPDLFQL